MPSPTKGRRLGGSPAHERLMLANLATSLFRHGRIKTTTAKARRLRPFAEQLITKAKRGDLHARRQVLTVVRDRDVSTALFDEIGPRYANRPGGYTRIIKAGPRRGDSAQMPYIELVEPLETTPAPSGQPSRKAAKQEAVEALAGGDKAAAAESKAEAEPAEEPKAASDGDEAKDSDAKA